MREQIKEFLQKVNANINWTLKISDVIVIVLMVVLYYFCYREQISMLTTCVDKLNEYQKIFGSYNTLNPYNISINISEILKNYTRNS